MTTYSEWTKQVGDQWVAALKRAEDVVAQAHQSSTKIDLPKAAVPEGVAQLAEAAAEQMPNPSEIVEANFQLTTRLLAAQRELTMKLLAASTADSKDTDKKKA